LHTVSTLLFFHIAMVTHFMWLFFAFTSLAYIHVTCVNPCNLCCLPILCLFVVSLNVSPQEVWVECHQHRHRTVSTLRVTRPPTRQPLRSVSSCVIYVKYHCLSHVTSLCYISVLYHCVSYICHVTYLSSVVTCQTSVKYHHMSYCHVSSYVISLTGDITLSGVITQVSSLSHRCHVSLILVFVIQVFLWMDMTL